MITLSYFDATIVAVVGLSLYTLIIVPLTIRYGTPDPKEKN